MNNIGELNKRQENFLNAILETGNVTEASKLANISRNTAYTYLKNVTFKRIYRERRNEMLKETTTRLQNASIRAVEVLLEIMNDNAVSPYARQQSAQTVLSMAYKAVETTDIVEQVEELEAKFESE
ncbi:replication protein [Streptococcus pluranimalium]|uniref:replication protein n=1 Tax=Streptococcus pluranimalium TaxID=82348 RepID=UPI0039FBA6B6